jgi:hypothetical protein
MSRKETIEQAYQLFNQRKVDELLQLLTPDAHWPNGWEGGFVNGHKEIKDYWLRQWKEIDPIVLPEKISQLKDGRFEVLVKQIIKDVKGKILLEGYVRHIYTFKEELVSSMEIESAG